MPATSRGDSLSASASASAERTRALETDSIHQDGKPVTVDTVPLTVNR